MTKFKALEVALVKQPVQKYSVIFPQNQRYNYAVVRYVVGALRSPWDGWRVEVQKRRKADPQYLGLRPNDRCCCGSGQKFKRCCQSKSVREVMHHQFDFDVRPPNGFPTFIEGDLAHDAREPFPEAVGVDERVNAEGAASSDEAFSPLRVHGYFSKVNGFDG